MARLFLALWPDPAEQAALRRYQQAWRWRPGSAVVQSDHLHLTLHFLGAVARDRLPVLAPALQVPHAPFGLRFDQPAVWRHGLAVLCASEVPPALAQLHAALAGVLQQQQLPVEARPLLPHVTLARRAGGSMPPEHLPVLRWQVHEYLLIESVLGRGADYRVLQSYPARPDGTAPAG